MSSSRDHRAEGADHRRSIMEILPSNSPTHDDVSAWFREFSSIETFLSPSDPGKASFIGREFPEWYNIYARSKPCLAYICNLADEHNTCPALVWCWMFSEFLTFEAFRDLILEGAECFHLKAGPTVYSPEHCHHFMGYCVQAIEDKADLITRRRAMTSFARLHHPQYDRDEPFHDASDH